MLERCIYWLLPEIIHALELVGILIITAGSCKAFYHYVISFFSKKRYRVQVELGHALAVGLEFKMGAEILKTVLIHDMSEILILGAIIILRALLSVLLHFEMKAEAAHPTEEFLEPIAIKEAIKIKTEAK